MVEYRITRFTIELVRKANNKVEDMFMIQVG